MTTDVVPILRVADVASAVAWYGRLGFLKQFEHRFEPHLPAYVGMRRDGAQIHLSEHAGDATPGTLVYIWVDEIDPIAVEFGVSVSEVPWGREIALTDPDGNRLRVAEPLPRSEGEITLGADDVETLETLEWAMWSNETRGDREWMDLHLAPEFTEFGYSGRTYTRNDILGQAIGSIDATLADFTIRPLGRDAALVTYRSVQRRGAANRASVWRRVDGRWLLSFHQGTPEIPRVD
jgi:hypothetical protein